MKSIQLWQLIIKREASISYKRKVPDKSQVGFHRISLSAQLVAQLNGEIDKAAPGRVVWQMWLYYQEPN